MQKTLRRYSSVLRDRRKVHDSEDPLLASTANHDVFAEH